MMKAIVFSILVHFHTAHAYSYAHDHSEHCFSWREKGYCDDENSNRTRELCPVSCGLLPELVDDADESCAPWASNGECEKNPLAVIEKCPLSCGHASNVCVDIDPNCVAWKHDGQCDSNPDYMNLHCAASCFCKRRCMDKKKDCASWAADGACSDNEPYMLQNCPVSCRVCESHTAVLSDSDHAKCAIWARNGECNKNPGHMAKECPDACGVGDIVCGDSLSFDECQGWKRDGLCESEDDRDFMEKNCASSCGVCTRLEKHYEHVLNAADHDEL